MHIINKYDLLIAKLVKFSSTGCKISGFFGSVGALSEIWSLSVVSFDRFQGVHHPLNSEKRITKSQVYFG